MGAVHIPRDKAAKVAARADIGETTAAANAGIGAEDDLLPGFYRFVGLNHQSTHRALQRLDLLIERIDLFGKTLGIAELGRRRDPCIFNFPVLNLRVINLHIFNFHVFDLCALGVSTGVNCGGADCITEGDCGECEG